VIDGDTADWLKRAPELESGGTVEYAVAKP